MALLDLVQNVANELGLPTISSVYGASDNQIQQLFSLLVRGGKDIRSSQEWPELTKEGTLTMVSAQDSYAMPSDLDRQIFQSQWDRTKRLPLVGPISAQEWQAIQAGLVTPTTQTRFRVKGYRTNTVYIYPTPGVTDAGKVLYYEYQSLNWVLPQLWTQGAVFGVNSYCSYNGNIYSSTAGGTAGSTPPTHTASSASDGGITWTAFTAAYEKPLADTDIFVIDQTLLEMDLKWRFMEVNGFQYQEYKRQAEEASRIQVANLKSAPVLTLHRPRGYSPFLRDDDLPEGSFG